jgi:hypothetical protein
VLANSWKNRSKIRDILQLASAIDVSSLDLRYAAGRGGKAVVNCQLPVNDVSRMDVQVEQRVYIRFCVKMGKTATETLQLLRDAYGDEALSRARVFEWHRRFVSGRISVEDDTRSGRPSCSRNEDNVVRIRDMVREDRTVTVRKLADALNINKSTCHQILREDLGKRKQ